MLRIKRDRGENMTELIIRSNRTLKNKLRDTEAKFEHWDTRYVQLRLEWGGHVARIGTFDPTRLTYRVFRHWNYEAIRHIANQNGGKQNHGRKIHIWRWEYYMYKYINPNWFTQAQDREVWTHLTFNAKKKITEKFNRR